MVHKRYHWNSNKPKLKRSFDRRKLQKPRWEKFRFIIPETNTTMLVLLWCVILQRCLRNRTDSIACVRGKLLSYSSSPVMANYLLLGLTENILQLKPDNVPLRDFSDLLRAVLVFLFSVRKVALKIHISCWEDCQKQMIVVFIFKTQRLKNRFHSLLYKIHSSKISRIISWPYLYRSSYSKKSC